MTNCTDCNSETGVEPCLVSKHRTDTSKPLEWETIPLCLVCLEKLNGYGDDYMNPDYYYHDGYNW